MLRFGSPRTNGARSAEAVPMKRHGPNLASVPCRFISISRMPVNRRGVPTPIGEPICQAMEGSILEVRLQACFPGRRARGSLV
jgi:hypothetical protein